MVSAATPLIFSMQVTEKFIKITCYKRNFSFSAKNAQTDDKGTFMSSIEINDLTFLYRTLNVYPCKIKATKMMNRILMQTNVYSRIKNDYIKSNVTLILFQN